MKRALLVIAALSSTLADAAAAADPRVAEAAARFAPEISWNAASVLRLNFTCRGRAEYAILGATRAEEVLLEGRAVGQRAPESVVAVFVAGIAQSPELFQASATSPEMATLSIESLNFKLREVERSAGATPEGLRQSRSCMGLKLSDGQRDSLHLYWNRARNEISAWSL